jgi:hypothetical protein
MPKDANGLNVSQAAFVGNYLITGNATRSCRLAYPGCNSDRSADGSARKLLGNTRIRAALEKARNGVEKRTEGDVTGRGVGLSGPGAVANGSKVEPLHPGVNRRRPYKT